MLTTAAAEKTVTGGRNAARRQARELNSVIHTHGLYTFVNGQKRRVLNAHIADGVLVVEDLYTQGLHQVAGLRFEDGYGREVII